MKYLAGPISEDVEKLKLLYTFNGRTRTYVDERVIRNKKTNS